jgi:hypothetical protein
MSNLDIWNAMKQPPKEALKNIGGGRLKGMTDIKPQWRYLAMTERFGPIGIGWKYTIDKLWTEPGAGGEVLAFAIITLYIKIDQWSDGIPGIGGSTIIDKETAGLHSNDEGYKMAVTDALSVAMKMIGVAADVYMGSWNGSKYKDDIPGLPVEDSALSDVRNSRGELSPPVPRGEIAPQRDGTRGALLGYRNKMASLYMARYPDGAEVFSVAEKSDMTADMHPDGRDLEPSKSDLDYVSGIYEKWNAKSDKRLDLYHNGNREDLDSVVEDGFKLEGDK